MSRRNIIIIVVAVVVVVIVLGVLAMFGGFNGVPGQNNGNPTTFEIQGMKVEILQQGTGEGAKAGDLVTTHYVGTLQDEKEFDSSIKRNAPFTFLLGQEKVLKGWDLGLMGAKAGEKRKLTIPYELGYGADGFPPTIPPQSTLIYVIDVLGISPAGQ